MRLDYEKLGLFVMFVGILLLAMALGSCVGVCDEGVLLPPAEIDDLHCAAIQDQLTELDEQICTLQAAIEFRIGRVAYGERLVAAINRDIKSYQDRGLPVPRPLFALLVANTNALNNNRALLTDLRNDLKRLQDLRKQVQDDFERCGCETITVILDPVTPVPDPAFP